MDNLTHTLFAVTLARTPLDRAGRGATATLVLASNAPDIDIVAAADGALSYLEWHRGPTHGPLGIIGLGIVTAGLVWTGLRLLDRRRRDDTPDPARVASFIRLAVISTVGTFFHVLMDLPTSYGTRLLSPFGWRWYAIDLVPIIDVYLLAILAACLFFGSRSILKGSSHTSSASSSGALQDARGAILSGSPDTRGASLSRLRSPEFKASYGEARRSAGGAKAAGSPWTARRRNAVIALTLMMANYGVRAATHREALAAAPRIFGPTLPERCDAAGAQGAIIDRWPLHRPLSARDAERRCLLEIAALPSFGSPFEWRLIAHLSNAYETRDINVLERRAAPSDMPAAPWRLVRRFPSHWTPAVLTASTTRTAQVFLGFSRFPAVRSMENRDTVTTVTWSDMRFISGPRRGPAEAQQAGFFMATVRLGPDGRVLEEKLGP